MKPILEFEIEAPVIGSGKKKNQLPTANTAPYNWGGVIGIWLKNQSNSGNTLTCNYEGNPERSINVLQYQ